MNDLRGRRVLVTGGTGFIGGRLVEKLVLEHGARVRVLTSHIAGASRVARFDVELARGDVASPDDVLRAAQGCDAIFHCAYGSRGSDAERRRVTVQGTRAVLDAALAVGARVVHASTMVVYGLGTDGDLDERTPRQRSGVAYADTKIEAEALALSYAKDRGLGVSVIQPTAVYGPYAPSWTTRVLASLRSGLVVLVDDGAGHANPVYIDDLADAMLLAAVTDAAQGEAFLIASGELVTWRTFHEAYEAMLGFSSTISMTRAEAAAHHAASQRRRGLASELLAVVREERPIRARIAKTREIAALTLLLRPVAAHPLMARAAARLKGGKAARTARPPREAARRVQSVHPKQAQFLAAKTVVRIDKARALLGYAPAFDLARGMAMTEAWARWANLLPERDTG
jgi:nucleoside-diphosphate-sugar epimerase